MHPLAMIEAKKSGAEHSPAELAALIEGFVKCDVPDYQMAAWLMAVRWQGLTAREAVDLTGIMTASGKVLDPAATGLLPPYIDKHSTGGVGDKLSLIIVPILVAAGATVIKMSGRGLGHTGGTVDKLEAIPGFEAQLSLEQVMQCAREAGGCLAAQSRDMVPADGLLYELRDATATVDSLPLIAASIMSKKLASGAQHILLDVKVGRGAFMRSVGEAEELARLMVSIAEGAGRQAVAVLTAMDEPLGAAIGNGVEVNEALEVLRGGGPADVRELSISLAAHALHMASDQVAGGLGRERRQGLDDAKRRAQDLLDSGRALEALLRIIRQQGGDTAQLLAAGGLPVAPARLTLEAPRSGRVAWVDALAVGQAAVLLGAGRREKGEGVDPAAGILLEVRAGDEVVRGQPMAEALARDEARLDEAAPVLERAFGWDDVELQAGGVVRSGTVLGTVSSGDVPDSRPRSLAPQ